MILDDPDLMPGNLLADEKGPDEKGSSCLLHNTLVQSLNSRPKPAFFAGALTAIGNSWGRSKINLLHRGASIKIVDFSNSTKRPPSPSFDFNTAGS
ncbi:hypothetical protein CXF95_13030 [Paraglaciecola sp. MB-3u-78]|nr:hypothetical protein CXF95_13030 [Paraglaciecola sp. MB-3u-78]